MGEDLFGLLYTMGIIIVVVVFLVRHLGKDGSGK